MTNKLTVYGSPLCPDCVEAERILSERKISYKFINITASMANLKAFLSYRDREAIFAEVRAAGRVGIPFFVLADGTTTLELETAIRALAAKE